MHSAKIWSMLVALLAMIHHIAAVADRTVGVEAMLGPANSTAAQHSSKRNKASGHNTR